MHSGTERRIHVEVTWFPGRCAFDFRYATELVIVTHELFALASARREATNPKWSTATSKPNDRPPNAKRRQLIPVRKCVILIERRA